jgi:hypothetical protein
LGLGDRDRRETSEQDRKESCVKHLQDQPETREEEWVRKGSGVLGV